MTISEHDKDMMKYVQGLFERPVYLVGGAVRDINIGISPKDYDFCTSLNPEEIKQSLKGKHRAYLTGERHGTIGFRVGDDMIELTTFRTEVYEEGSRKPNVNFVDSLTEDLSRRDFTINSMAIRCDDLRLIDPFGGLADINNNILRAVGNSKTRFKEDPLRILRAIRIASKYNLNIEEKTYDRVCKMTPLLLNISKERWVDELDKMLMLNSYGVASALNWLWDANIFAYIIPEMQLQLYYDQESRYHDYQLHEHTTLVVCATPQDINLRWAALLHDIAKPFVRTENKNGWSNYINHKILGGDMVERIARHLKWSNDRRKSVVDLVKNHLKDDCELRQYDNESKQIPA